MTHQDRIAEMSRAIRSWCIARTSTVQDAEDLCQDVLLAMLEAAPNLRDEGAFYGFMWGVARNVYRQWAKKAHQINAFARKQDAELTEAVWEQSWPEDAPEDVALLRRELSLLSRRYRDAAVLYYVRGMRTAEIAQTLSISVSMVKYLLFKARIILKEGMEMERNYGVQSYHPRRLDLRYWGAGPNHYYGAAGTLLRQNILFACYNDALTAEQIALEVGVGLPYMEDDLHALHEVNLLTCIGGKYRTNIVIFTEDFIREAQQQIAPDAQAIADRVTRCLAEQEEAIRALGFTGCDMNQTAFAWQMSALLLHQAVIHLAGSQACPELPKDKWGVPCLCWAVEGTLSHLSSDSNPFVFGASSSRNPQGDWIQFLDFPINGDMVHHAFYRSQSLTNVFLHIARNEAGALSENDAALAAELIKKGYVLQRSGKLTVNCPVFTTGQYKTLLALIDGSAQEICKMALSIREKEAALLAEHVPEHLKPIAANMAYFRLFEDAITLPMAQLYAKHVLSDAKCSDLLPTTYVVLAESH